MIFNNKKGIFFTLDAVLALVILMVLIIFPSYFLTSNTSMLDSSSALLLSSDVGNVLIESSILENDLLAGNYTNTSLYLNQSVPSQFGSYIKVTPESSSSFNIVGNDCKLKTTYRYKATLSASGNYDFEVILC